MIQWEEVELKDATHVEINGEVHELKADGNVKKSGLLCSGNFRYIDILIGFNKLEQIHVDLFRFLGIKCLREKKQEPIEFIYTVGGGIAPPNEAYGKTFLCVEIEKEEKE
jgi:hypothetical protein